MEPSLEIEMDFIYLFNLLDFDQKGQVRETSDATLNMARSNYLYLLSKYNQKMLDEGEKIPDFFKTELQSVLSDVENGGDFEKAKRVVLQNCKETVQEIASRCLSDKKLIVELNKALAKKTRKEGIEKAVNHKQATYMLTSLANKCFDKVVEIQAQGE